MPHAGRVGDVAQCSNDAHQDGGRPVKGEAVLGSPDVIINRRAALRVGDPGEHQRCSGPNTWQASQGSRGVFINGRPAIRRGDATQHCGGEGQLVEGSPDVLLGDGEGGAPRERPHDRTVIIDVTDALGRPLHDVVVSVFCPHEQRPDQESHGTASVGGLCSGATVTVHKPLQAGTWDDNASPMSARILPVHHTHHGKSGGSSTGGALAPSEPAEPGGDKAIVHAPAAEGTAGGKHSVHLPRPKDATEIVIPTVHNWVELVYRAFGHGLPTGPMEVALLGVREASLSAAAPGEHVPVEALEKEADAGDLADVSFTREHRAPAYNDLLFCVFTDKTVHHRQHVEVFECTIDASPGGGPLHLPFLREGHLFHARPGPYGKHYPGHDVTLHVFPGLHEHTEPKGTTAEHVIAVASKQRGTTEWPPGSNRQKYGAWYNDNGAYWCAQFVSWVFSHAGMPLIHYEYCPTGADMFRSGAWGTWHGGGSHAEPGDIVFYQFKGPGTDLDHTGIVVKDHGSYLTTIEGNTSAPGSSGSQDNGGGVYLKTRDKNSLVAGFGRPRFHEAHHEPVSFIRWGGEGAHVHGKSTHGSTLLHHHYFKPGGHGTKHPDPAAERYRRFMHLYNGARNKQHIPYLVVSSKYLRSYSEWVAWIEAHAGQRPGARSVVLESGLASPAGHAHHYLPSFLGKSYADRVLQRARHMHDHHRAALLREALMGCLMTLSI